MGFSLKTTVMISDKIISPLQSVNPGGAEKVDWYAPTKTAFVITGEYTDDKGVRLLLLTTPRDLTKASLSTSITLKVMFQMFASAPRA